MTEDSIVFVIDDDASMRTSLGSLIRSVGLRVKLFSSAAEFLEAERPDLPCCLVIDIRLPRISGLDFQQKLLRNGVHIPIVFITGHGDIPMSVRAMKAGAIDFLTKPFRDQDLIDAIQLGIEKDRQRHRRDKEVAELRARFDLLTPRERQVLTLVISGLPNKHVAAEIGITEATAKVHRSQLMRKVGANSLPELVRMAQKLDLPNLKQS